MHLGAQVSQLGVQRLLARLEKNRRGLLPTLRAVLFGRDDVLSAAGRALAEQRLADALVAARRGAEELFAALARRLDAEPGPSPVLRLPDDVSADPVWSAAVAPPLENLLVAFAGLRDGAQAAADRLATDEPSDRRTQLVAELRAVVGRLDAAAAGLSAALRPAPGGPPTVRWLERRGRKAANVAVAAVPLDLAPVLKANLFDRIETVVLTSATLAAGGEFDYLEARLGLDLPPSRVTVREIHASPFDFRSQCVFGIPTDLPEPRDDESGHDAAVARALLELAHASDGGMFVLFTSHGALRRAAAAVRDAVGSRWPLLVQGDASRDQLLRRFRDAGSGILLGTDSFWEGVDVPGRALRVLILAKLPFKVPSEPLTAARIERLEAQGLNGFQHYLIPNAALKLKQGFGRLIRSRRDVGAVVLLDRRVVTKRYGPLMLQGLPRATRVVGGWTEVRGACEEFFARHGVGAGANVQG
jgi:ATP-dependent DNA helicase DinG